MKKYQKIISLVFVILLLSVCVFTSCKKDVGSEMSANSQDDTFDSHNDATKEGSIVISENGKVKYEIIHSEYFDSRRNGLVEDFYKDLVKYTGDEGVLISHADKDGYNSDKKEILIGDTGYPESDEVFSTLGYGEWAIRHVNNKLVIAAFSNQAYDLALAQLSKDIKAVVTEDKSVTLLADYSQTGVAVELANQIPRIDGEYPWVADEGQNTAIALFTGANKEKYSAYIETICAAGYSLHATNTISENVFNTYYNDKYAIHAAFHGADSSMEITVEKKTVLATRAEDNQWTKNDKVVPSMAQLGQPKGNPGAMSYCYQLADGSFIVIDGGYPNDGKILFDYMKAKAPDPQNIVIAAWLITHMDPDHCQAIKTFFNEAANTAHCEMVITSEPSRYSHIEDECSPSKYGVVELANSLPGCASVKAHTGQKFYVRNATVEILYTLDNHLPDDVRFANAMSLVFTIEMEGERVLFMGDSTDSVAATLVKYYGDYLKSDMLQLAHHGQRNGTGLNMPATETLYSIVRPEVVLWPSGDIGYFSFKLHKWNFVATDTARETYIAGYDITVFEFPYRYFSAYKFVPEQQREPVCADTVSPSENLNYGKNMDDTKIDKISWNNVT